MIDIFLPIIPVAKGRPRFYRRGNYVGTYTPKKTEDYEKELRKLLKGFAPSVVPQGPVAIGINFRMPPPKSWKPKDGYWHTKRPDIDNLAKSVLDAMRGSFFKDDSQICKLYVVKHYPHIISEDKKQKVGILIIYCLLDLSLK